MGLIKAWTSRSTTDKLLDGSGLLFQGLLVPALASMIGLYLLPAVFSKPESAWVIPGWILFLLPFTLVDYVYYWNHRLLHSAKLWFLHRVHHSSEKMDIWVTSRNSLWTPLFLVYIWVHAFLIFMISDPIIYVMAMWLHGILDMIRHSGVSTPQSLKFLGAVFILPEDHEWHHSLDKSGVNYGANLNLWDRLHGSFYRPEEKPVRFGIGQRDHLINELILPWRLK